jgi:predicted O-methyltransferase YrrM
MNVIENSYRNLFCVSVADAMSMLLQESEKCPILHTLRTIWNDGGFKEAESGALTKLRHSLDFSEGAVLYAMVRCLSPSSTLETGFAFGISALCIVAGSQSKGTHLAIDPLFRQWAGTTGLVLSAKLGLPISVREEYSELVLPQLVATGRGSLDFAFIDGRHTFDNAFIDFYFVDQLLAVGGTVIFHDTDAPAIATVLNYIAANRAYDMFPHPEVRLCACVKRECDKRRWYDYSPFVVVQRSGWDRAKKPWTKSGCRHDDG